MRQPGAFSGISSGGISGRNGQHSLPLARIKKIMKQTGEEVKMISGEAPIVFSKACELFIEELTARSWMVTVKSKRRTMQKEDVAAAVRATDIFDFLVQMLSRSEGRFPPPAAASAAGEGSNSASGDGYVTRLKA